MIVRRYMGKTNQEALEKVKASLGNDAIILSTRKIRQRGIKGFFLKPLVEVVAAVDDSKTSTDNLKKNDVDLSQYKLNEFEQQVSTINTAIDKLLDRLDNTKQSKQDQIIDASVPSGFYRYFEHLTKKEVHTDVAMALIKEAHSLGKTQDMAPLDSLVKVISSYIGAPKPMPTNLPEQKRVLFIGPTGVGKTTTLAKLAALYSIEYECNVGLITADTYRIGAANQLKTYSDILGVPLEIIYAPSEITEPLNRLSHKDIIFIDTAGKSIRDDKHPEEIETLIDLSSADEIFLCISAATSYQACENIIKTYEFIKDYKIIYTKADEVVSYGTILNCCYLSNKPISYITTGQSVPDDIEVLDPSIIKSDMVKL